VAAKNGDTSENILHNGKKHCCRGNFYKNPLRRAKFVFSWAKASDTFH
jgi:hypothetical protein